MAVIDVRTIKELYDFVLNSNSDDIVNIDGDELKLRYTISGSSWNGNVDIRVAEYVKALHETFSFMYALIENINLADAKKKIKKEKLVTIKVEDGSLRFELLNLSEIVTFLTDRLRTMNDESLKDILMLLIYCTTGYFTFKLGLKFFSDMHIRKIDLSKAELYLKEKDSTYANIEKIIDKVQKPNQVLSKQLERDDIVTIYSTGEQLTAKEAQDRFKYKVVADEHTFKADDKYKVIDMEAIENNYIGKILSEDDIMLKVVFNVTAQEKDQLLNSLGNREFIDMNLNVDTKDDKLAKGTVLSLDKARETSKSLSNILEMLQED